MISTANPAQTLANNSLPSCLGKPLDDFIREKLIPSARKLLASLAGESTGSPDGIIDETTMLRLAKDACDTWTNRYLAGTNYTLINCLRYSGHIQQSDHTLAGETGRYRAESRYSLNDASSRRLNEGDFKLFYLASRLGRHNKDVIIQILLDPNPEHIPSSPSSKRTQVLAELRETKLIGIDVKTGKVTLSPEAEDLRDTLLLASSPWSVTSSPWSASIGQVTPLRDTTSTDTHTNGNGSCFFPDEFHVGTLPRDPLDPEAEYSVPKYVLEAVIAKIEEAEMAGTTNEKADEYL